MGKTPPSLEPCETSYRSDDVDTGTEDASPQLGDVHEQQAIAEEIVQAALEGAEQVQLRKQIRTLNPRAAGNYRAAGWGMGLRRH